MTDTTPNAPEEKPSLSAVPYALLVPVLVVMAQSAWVVQGYDFRHNALLAQLPDPFVLGGMAVIAVISFFVIRPFMMRATDRWTAFLSCVVGFTVLVYVFCGKLVE